MDYPKFIVSNQKDESISIQRVNNDTALQDWFEILKGTVTLIISVFYQKELYEP